jgi:hypothetical protein
VSQSSEPIRTSRLGAVLICIVVVSSVFLSGYSDCWVCDLSIRLRDATYFVSRTKHETNGQASQATQAK